MENNLDKNKIVLGLSGGVDSTTAALALKNKGFEVIGFYFDVMDNNPNGLKEAKAVADQLGIRLIHKNVSKDFEELVIGNFCSEYKKGRTPNPCIVCNPNIKFRELLKVADSEGAYYIATGHYAKIYHDENTNLYHVQMGKNIKKDQSYMLYRLGQEVLSRLIFPLGDAQDKEDIRQMARDNNMINSEKKDSQEICFIDPTSSYIQYLKEKGISSKPGNFIDIEGNILGQHQGITNYTIGQRKGLGIALGKPAFVTEINSENNTITLGDNEDLFSNEVVSVDNVFVDPNRTDYSQISAKVRYTTLPTDCSIISTENGLCKTIFKDAVRAATPGQSIVFYHGDLVVGGGFVK